MVMVDSRVVMNVQRPLCKMTVTLSDFNQLLIFWTDFITPTPAQRTVSR